jgi:hypothetical protein
MTKKQFKNCGQHCLTQKTEFAKSKKVAVEWATSISEKRIRQTLGEEYDADYYSEGYSLGDESPNDDEADEEYPYDE